MMSMVFMFVFTPPVQAKVQDVETQKLIIVLLQKIVMLKQQLLVLQQQEALDSIVNTDAITTNVNNSIVVLSTSLGDIEIELFEDMMPITAGNFKDLVQKSFYDNTKFHRVIDGFMIQGGDPLTKTDDNMRYGTGGPGYAIDDEHVSGEFLTNIKGTISMANSGPNSGGSQFFINLVDNKNLDFDKQPLSSQHPVFGHVINGMDVVNNIGGVETDTRSLPTEEVVVESVVIK